MDTIKKIQNILKYDKKLSKQIDYDEYDYDYIVVDKKNTDKYICGNLVCMYYKLPLMIDFNFSDNPIIKMIQIYNIVSHNIILENVFIYDMYSVYENLISNGTIPKIKINNIEIDFNEIESDKLKKFFTSKRKINSFIYDKLKLKKCNLQVSFYSYNQALFTGSDIFNVESVYLTNPIYNNFIKNKPTDIMKMLEIC